MKSSKAVLLLTMMLAPLFFLTRANAQVGTNQNAPNWWQIETAGQPVDIKILWGPSAITGTDCLAGYNCEWLNATADYASDGQRIRIPMTYYAFTGPGSPGGETIYGGCGYSELNSDPNVPVNYYVPGTTTKLNDWTAIVPNPSMFNVSQPYSNAKGLVTLGYTSGIASGIPYAVATAYVSSNRCSAADTEWGFYKTLTPDQYLRFYYSQFTNCAYPAQNSQCRVSPYGTANQVAQQNGSLVVDITNISPLINTTNYYYSMYIIPAAVSTYPWPPPNSAYAFRIQVLDQNTGLTNCTATWKNTSTGATVRQTSGPCTADFPIDSWFPITNGAFSKPSYLVTGTQMVGPPNYVGPFFQVNGVWLGF